MPAFPVLGPLMMASFAIVFFLVVLAFGAAGAWAYFHGRHR